MKYENLPLKELIKNLISLCDDGKTGTLFIVSDNHSMQLQIDHGKIIGANSGGGHGLKVLQKIRQLKKVKFSFAEGLLMPQHNLSSLEYFDVSNAEIFAKLDINLLDFVFDKEKKVLIIDDSHIARRVAKEVLLTQNYEVLEASDGLQGLAVLAKEKPDLILLDIVMPEMDGYKVLSLIKKNKTMKKIPIIMLTARDKLFDKIKGKISDADEYLTKPFMPQDLIDKVNFYLE